MTDSTRGAEQVSKYRQYEYRANSNLVLTTGDHRPRVDEPSGEPESLKDYLTGTKFGDKVVHAKPDTGGAGTKRKKDDAAAAAKRSRREEAKQSVLGLGDDMDSYRPRSRETRQAYEDLLHLLSSQLGALRTAAAPHAERRCA